MAETLLLLPTRGRPRRIEEAIEGWRANSTANCDLMVCLDEDDPYLDEYQRHPDVQYRIGPRLRMCPTVNAAAKENAHRYKYLGFIGDDHVIRTPEWDVAMVEAIGEWGIAYGDDKLQSERLATHCVLSSNIVQTLGYMALPGLIHLYMDDFWMSLGRALGFLHYLPAVTIEHMHPAAGKAPNDERYHEVNAPTMYAADRAVFERWRDEGGLEQDLQAIWAAM